MRRDEVLKAINRTGPARVPIYFFNKDIEKSDIVAMGFQDRNRGLDDNRSEWGFVWERLDETMGQPKTHALTSLDDLPGMVIPDPKDPRRFEGAAAFAETYADRYRLAGLGLSGFTLMWCLRGFEELLLDIALDPDGVERLADVVFGFENAIIEELPKYAFDAVMLADDWGTQQGMMISPQTWRRIFKPRYARQFDLAHRLGMHVYFHSCGQYMPIIPDLIEIGLDILNISQPNLYDMAEVAEKFGGQICFVCPVSYQTTSISGARDDIFADVGNLIRTLGRFNGGLIGYVEEYHAIGLSDANYAACVEAFQKLGHYEPHTA